MAQNRKTYVPGHRNGHKGIHDIIYLLFPLFALFFLSVTPESAIGEDSRLLGLSDKTVSFFRPMTGRIISIEGKRVILNLGAKDAVHPGMRYAVLREGAPFIHPVTKELLGNIEAAVGTVEVTAVEGDSSVGEIISGEALAWDKVRISEIKINLLFCQSRDIDWRVADSYYQGLRETGRFSIIDTNRVPDNPSSIIEEAKLRNADVVLLLTTESANASGNIRQRLYWVTDGKLFAEMKIKTDAISDIELKKDEDFLSPQVDTALLRIDLPFSGRLIATGDLDGDGKTELVIATARGVKFFVPGVTLYPALNGAEITGTMNDDYLWLDVIDLNRNGRDEVVITSMRKGEIISFIYEFNGTGFSLLYQDNGFLRKLDNGLLAQSYDESEGFSGEIASFLWNGEYKKSGTVKLPTGVGIYDFLPFQDMRQGRPVLAYDNKGFLNLYDNKDERIWRSKASAGGFITVFQKSTSTSLIEAGEWAMKDRLIGRKGDILYLSRIPLAEMAMGFGYKSSQIRRLKWNGHDMGDDVLVDGLKGSALDFAVLDDRIMVLTSPLLGFSPGNIFRGESPSRAVLNIFSIQGK